MPTLRGIFKDRHARTCLTARKTFNKRLNEIFWKPRGHTIEEMLTILRDWEKETCADGLDPATVAVLRRNLYVLIQRAVFEGKSTRPQHLNSLIDLMSKKFDMVMWASFNWDCVFEASYWYCRRGNPKLAIELDNWHATSRKNEFLKLHGGINW